MSDWRRDSRHGRQAKPDHRQAGDQNRHRQVRGPSEGAEDENPDPGPDEIEAALRRKDTVDEVDAIELVGDPRHVSAARDGPPQSPEALRHDEEREGGDESGHRHSGSHDDVGDDQGETSTRGVRQRAGWHLGDHNGQPLEHADQHEL
jgi:hypothetical protein